MSFSFTPRGADLGLNLLLHDDDEEPFDLLTLPLGEFATGHDLVPRGATLGCSMQTGSSEFRSLLTSWWARYCRGRVQQMSWEASVCYRGCIVRDALGELLSKRCGSVLTERVLAFDPAFKTFPIARVAWLLQTGKITDADVREAMILTVVEPELMERVVEVVCV